MMRVASEKADGIQVEKIGNRWSDRNDALPLLLLAFLNPVFLPIMDFLQASTTWMPGKMKYYTILDNAEQDEKKENIRVRSLFWNC